MKTLAGFIADKTPKFNKHAVEGLCYHRLNHAINYIDNFIKYSCNSKTNTHLQYLGYRELLPKEEIKFLFNKTSKVIYDIAENDIYLVDFMFKYGDEEQIRHHQFYIPYMNKGNIIHLSGNNFLVQPVLSDKVISIGDKIIFINILTAKYSFTRTTFSIQVQHAGQSSGIFNRVSIVNTELYKNQVKKLEDTTKANTTVMHYLLANYGYTKTMNMLLGFVPKPVYDYSKTDKVILSSTGNAPHGYIKINNSIRKQVLSLLWTKISTTKTFCMSSATCSILSITSLIRLVLMNWITLLSGSVYWVKSFTLVIMVLLISARRSMRTSTI